MEVTPPQNDRASCRLSQTAAAKPSGSLSTTTAQAESSRKARLSSRIHSKDASELPVICVVGLGYIGLPTAAMLANHGYRVHGVEVDSATRNTINAGKAHVIEPDLDGLVKRGVDAGCLEAFALPGEAEAVHALRPHADHRKRGAGYVAC